MNEFTEQKSIWAIKNKGHISGSGITRATNSWSLKSILRKSHYISLFPQPSSDIWPWPSSEMKYWVRDTFKLNQPIFCGHRQEVEKQEHCYGIKAESSCVTINGTEPGIWKCRALAITGNKICQYMQTTMKTPPNNKGRSDRMVAGCSLEAMIQPHSGSFISKPIYLNICETYDAVMGWQDKIPCLFCDLCACNVWPQKISKYWYKEHGKNKRV